MKTDTDGKNWTFFNHYILFPRDAPTPEDRKANMIKTIMLGIFTVGLVHAACAIAYGMNKLFGRVSTNPPPGSQSVTNQAKSSLDQTRQNTQTPNPPAVVQPIPPPAKFAPTPPPAVVQPTPPPAQLPPTTVAVVQPTPPLIKLTPQKVAKLTPQQIKGMTPDQQGLLIDQYAIRKNEKPSILTQAQLKGILRSAKGSNTVKTINIQEASLGHCGRYAINNAFQSEKLSTNEFLKLAGEVFMKTLGMSKEDVQALVSDKAGFGVDAGIIKYILEEKFDQPITDKEIKGLDGIDISKQKAIEDFIGDAKWIIIANLGQDSYDMPSLTDAPYPFASGHIVAMRKDDKGEWWLIDSRAHQPINIPLAAIPRTCTIIAPK